MRKETYSSAGVQQRCMRVCLAMEINWHAQ